MSISAEIHRVLLTVSLVMLLGGFGNAFDYFTDYCGKTFDIGDSGGYVDSQFGYYDNDLDCTVTLTTSSSRKIFLDFTSLNVKGDLLNCKKTDYVEVFDGSTKDSSLGLICGEATYDVTYSYVSTTNSITVQFKTDNNVTGPGFYMTYTSFSESSITPCTSLEFKCDNGRCINKTLTEDSRDNCGDYSDWDLGGGGDLVNVALGILKWGIGVLIAIIVGIIVAVVLCCVCMGCLCYHCCCKNRQQQQTQYTGVIQTTGPPAYNQQQPPMAMQPAGQPAKI